MVSEDPPPPRFVSRLRPLSILDLERMSPAQLQRREFEEEQERLDWIEEQRRRERASALPARRLAAPHVSILGP